METEKSLWQQMNDKLWDDYENKNDIMKRGYCICEVNDNDPKNILIVGINPSYRDGKDKPGNNQPYPLLQGKKDDTDPYWKHVAAMLKDSSCDLINDAAYVDVFSCRGAHQTEIMKRIICNPDLSSYVVAQVEATQKIIENVIKPKVIIIKFKSAWAFFGKDPKFTWMGYTFEKIDQFNNFDICKITGLSDNEDRINKKIFKDTNLKGSIVVFAKHNFLNKKDFYPTPEKINQWVEMAK